jgi:hypothetical protein
MAARALVQPGRRGTQLLVPREEAGIVVQVAPGDRLWTAARF